jgi:hypothetical protein
MPIRLGQFYACVLVFVCLTINIAFFADVREPFLGDDDPLASIKATLGELDIPAKIAGLYPKVQSKAEEDQDEIPVITEIPEISPPVSPTEESPAPKEELPAPRGQRRSTPSENAPPPKVEPEQVTLNEPETLPETLEEPKFHVATIVPEDNLQTSAVMPAPLPAVIKPDVTDLFKPIMGEPIPMRKP